MTEDRIKLIQKRAFSVALLLGIFAGQQLILHHSPGGQGVVILVTVMPAALAWCTVGWFGKRRGVA